jgi:aminoglycoside phosphotransferase family enzyme
VYSNSLKSQDNLRKNQERTKILRKIDVEFFIVAVYTRLGRFSMQKEIVKALLNPDTYDVEPGQIQCIQTHISLFLDFTTLDKRRYYCERELELNRRLCHGMYLDVVPINKSDVFKIKGEGDIVEYSVKMVRMPHEAMMNKLLEARKVDGKLLDRIAKILVEFHSQAETNETIAEFGSIATLKFNWKENFEQTHEFIGSTISSHQFNSIQDAIDDFIQENIDLFKKRMKNGRIRDCHGDVHTGNIFVTDEIFIFDAIEFNDRFRYSDVISDIAFLAMDLDFKKRTDLSTFFINRYKEYSEDKQLTKLLPFYKCYRAYVRGKVTSFKLKDENISRDEKTQALEEANAYFELSTDYAKFLN